MPRSRQALRESLPGLAWSLWAEVGVPGWTRHHQDVAVDIEPLILFTAGLGDRDPRLRDESTDWCIRHGRLVSRTRLKNLLRASYAAMDPEFREYAATVNEHSAHAWPGAGLPRPFEPRRRAGLNDLARPSLIGLRLRALFGVSARAEVLRVLIAEPGRAFSTSDLAGEIQYGKRNTAEALEALRLGGLLDHERVRNSGRFRIRRHLDLRAFVGALPGRFDRWLDLLPFLYGLLRLVEQAPDLGELERRVAGRKLLAHHQQALQRSGVPLPPPPAAEPGAWASFEEWANELCRGLAQGQAAAQAATR